MALILLKTIIKIARVLIKMTNLIFDFYLNILLTCTLITYFDFKEFYWAKTFDFT